MVIESNFRNTRPAAQGLDPRANVLVTEVDEDNKPPIFADFWYDAAERDLSNGRKAGELLAETEAQQQGPKSQGKEKAKSPKGADSNTRDRSLGQDLASTPGPLRARRVVLNKGQLEPAEQGAKGAPGLAPESSDPGIAGRQLFAILAGRRPGAAEKEVGAEVDNFFRQAS